MEFTMATVFDFQEGLYTPEVDAETRKRIKLAVYAYAYEFESDSLVSDGEFDELALQINPDISTRRSDLDEFFRMKFGSHTGQWIHSHPELEKIKGIYHAYYRKGRKKKKRS
jgi:hypothetical protein